MTALSARPARTAAMLPYQQSFEAGTTLPEGWADSSFGELLEESGVDARLAQDGKQSLRLANTVWDGGASQVRLTGVPVRAFTDLTVSAALWATAGSAPVTISVGKPNGAIYLQRTFHVYPTWRRCALRGPIKVDDPDAVVTIGFRGTGSLRIDSVRIQEGTAPEEPLTQTVPAPVKGNRVYNSSFELGLVGWSVSDRLKLNSVKAGNGASNVFLRQPETLTARPFTAVPGQTYTFSALLRGDRANGRAELALVELGSGKRYGQTLEVPLDWERRSITVTLPCDASDQYVPYFAPQGLGQMLEVDAVQVEEGPLSDYASSSPVEAAITLPRESLTPDANSVVTVPVRVWSREPLPENSSILSRVLGFSEETLALATTPLTAGQTLTDAQYTVRVPTTGPVRLRAEIRAGAAETVAEAVLVALPASDLRPNPASFFGGQGSSGADLFAPSAAARAGIRWWRLQGPSGFLDWNRIEAQPDAFRWPDLHIRKLRQLNLTLLGVLGETPGWAGDALISAKSPPTALPPLKTADFGDYVKQVTSHYRTDVAAWEIRNRPTRRDQWAGTPERYVSTVKSTARATDTGAKAQFVSGALDLAAPEFTHRAVSRGLLDAVSTVSLYLPPDPDAVLYVHRGRDRIAPAVETLKGQLKAADRAALPIWLQTPGIPSPTYQSWGQSADAARVAARQLSRLLILAKAAGAQKLFLTDIWDEAGPGRTYTAPLDTTTALFDAEGAPKPALAALAVCAKNLEGAAPAGAASGKNYRAYLFTKPAPGKAPPDTIVALWSPIAQAGPANMLLEIDPALISLESFVGNNRAFILRRDHLMIQLKDEPLFMRVEGTKPALVLAALRKAIVNAALRPGEKTSPNSSNPR